MNKYFDNLNETVKEYFSILSNEIPDFIYEYVNTPELLKQNEISVSCGNYYTKLFEKQMWYSSLDHSVAVALIVWNFTKDRRQALAGLFHDIATPVFKHCIDFMNGDYEKQESTEELTYKIIKDSKEISKLLERDKIKIEEVADYHIYPIADNDTPQLSVDRLEYTLSNGLRVRRKLLSLDEIRNIYQNIEVQENENGIDELGFKCKEIAEKLVNTAVILQTEEYVSNRTKLSMQFLADIIKRMCQKEYITKNDLYKYTEKEVIRLIENCEDKKISECFQKWRNCTEIQESDEIVQNKYCKSINGKLRYINPLVKYNNGYERINTISEEAKKEIDYCVNFKTKKYAYFNFDF